jgi:calcineurin-like phosphoesterase family protein
LINEFFIADTHLGHKNIIKYCNRPFRLVAHMDDTIIDNINEVVKSNDILYHLGDFALC